MKTAADALIDSNVVIALVAECHEHHAATMAFVSEFGGKRLAVAAHSYAEAYATLTRRTARAPFQWAAEDAWATLENVAAATLLVGLSPPQIFDTIRSYADDGGIGARLYDRLIGQVAIQYSIPVIVTWNIGPMRDLFPGIEILDPIGARAALSQSGKRETR